jgi:hypothetical protein
MHSASNSVPFNLPIFNEFLVSSEKVNVKSMLSIAGHSKGDIATKHDLTVDVEKSSLKPLHTGQMIGDEPLTLPMLQHFFALTSPSRLSKLHGHRLGVTRDKALLLLAFYWRSSGIGSCCLPNELSACWTCWISYSPGRTDSLHVTLRPASEPPHGLFFFNISIPAYIMCGANFMFYHPGVEWGGLLGASAGMIGDDVSILSTISKLARLCMRLARSLPTTIQCTCPPHSCSKPAPCNLTILNSRQSGVARVRAPIPGPAHARRQNRHLVQRGWIPGPRFTAVKDRGWATPRTSCGWPFP